MRGGGGTGGCGSRWGGQWERAGEQVGVDVRPGRARVWGESPGMWSSHAHKATVSTWSVHTVA